MFRTNYTVGADIMVLLINGVVCRRTHNCSMANILVSRCFIDQFLAKITRPTSVKWCSHFCFGIGDMCKMHTLPAFQMISEICQFQGSGCVITCGVAFQKWGYRWWRLQRKSGEILHHCWINIEHLELNARWLGSGWMQITCTENALLSDS